jgi:hypothetical protein
MGGIFISYRREDSAGWTGRLSEHLRERFGPESIFMDIDTIQPGADFTEALQTAVSSCDVLLAIIGPEWATVTDKSGKPRLEDPTDWVRTEIATALTRKIRVIPVLVGGASVPTINLLPDDLDTLAQRQAHELTDKRWGYDVEQLVKTLPAARQRPPTQLEVTPTASSTGQFKWVVIGVLTVTLAISAWMVLKPGTPSAPPQDDVLHTSPQDNPDIAPPQKPPTKPELAKPKPAAASHITHLRAGQEARLKSQFLDHVYTILAAEIRPQPSSTVLLGLKVRLTNNSSGGVNFWSDTFRLLVDGVPRAPTSFLNDVVDSHSAKDGAVEFALPDTVTHVVLLVREGNIVAEIPFDLTAAIERLEPPVATQQSLKLRTAKFPIALPANQEARLKTSFYDYLYKVIATDLDRQNSSTLRLRFKIRLTNNSSGGVSFWSDTFRLLIDGVPRAPTSFLNDVVGPHSAKDGVVEFALPDTVTQVALQLRQGEEVAEIPYVLTP